MIDFLKILTAYSLNIIYIIAIYVFSAFCLYKIAKNNNLSEPWMAFVPFLQYYIIGELCEEYIIFGYRIKNMRWVVVLFELIRTTVSFASGFLLFPIRIVVSLAYALIMHKFFYILNPERALIYSIIAMIGKLPMAIVLFLSRDERVTVSAAAYKHPLENKL